MKREEIQSHIEGITDEQLDWLMGQNGADVNNVRKQLDASNAANETLKGQLSDAQAELDQAKQANMTAEERFQAQIDAATKAQHDFAVKSSRLDARSVLVDAGIPGDSMDPILDLVADGDSEKSVERAKSIAALIQGERDKAAAEAEKKLVGSTPKPEGKGAKGAMTKAEFDALDWNEQIKLIHEDPNLLPKLK